MPKPYNAALKPYSRALRSNMTDAEALLWSRLRRKQIGGVQFYRQKPLLQFIVDFYCPSVQLVIECDGSQHYTQEGLEADKQRDLALAALGLTVLRFSNHQIMTQLDAVCDEVFRVVNPPSPLG